MYGKIFDSMYDGTLVEEWQALITFQQMIVLCDPDGTIDMTPNAISRRTGIPLEHIKEGIKILEHEDPHSRSSAEQGRRIKRLDDHRSWGWSIVNHRVYRDLSTQEERREQNRINKQNQRDRDRVSKCQRLSSMSAHTDTDTDTDTDTKEIGHSVTAGFQKWWSEYPKKVKKKTALEIWKRKKPDADLLIADVQNRLQNDHGWKEGYIPHPTTYLNQERWEDEIEGPKQGKKSYAEELADGMRQRGMIE